MQRHLVVIEEAVFFYFRFIEILRPNLASTTVISELSLPQR